MPKGDFTGKSYVIFACHENRGNGTYKLIFKENIDTQFQKGIAKFFDPVNEADNPHFAKNKIKR